MRIVYIAQNTFLEAVRQKFFVFIAFLSIGLVISSYYLRSFGFGISELKFMHDFGYGSIFMFGTLLSIVMSSQLYFNEIEHRTVVTLLSKPISRLEFIIGKLAGVALLLLSFTAIISLLQTGMLAWREGIAMDMYPEYFEAGRLISYKSLAVYSIILWIQFLLVAAITLLVASFSNSNLFTVSTTLFIISICQIQHIAHNKWNEDESLLLRSFAWLCGRAFPNFQVFNVGESLFLKTDNILSSATCLGIIGYGAIYIIIFIVLAAFIFKNREI